jgi:thioesterase domain-containing protein
VDGNLGYIAQRGHCQQATTETAVAHVVAGETKQPPIANGEAILFRNRHDLPVHVRGKSHDDQAHHLIGRMISFRLLPPTLYTTYFSRFIEVYKANAIAAARYRLATKISIPVTLFRAAEQDRDLDMAAPSNNPMFGWDRYAAVVDVIATSGTHLTMFAKPHVDGLAARLSAAIVRGRAAPNIRSGS